MSDIQKTPNTLPWPPMIYLAAAAIAVILNGLYPLPWISRPLSELLFAIGWMMVAGAIAIDVSAIRTMRRAKTTIMPHKGSDHLVTSGAFSFTRNPIYVGNTMLMLALGLITEIVWFVPLAFIAAFATQKLAIEREEKHLEARFGKKWRDYTKKVRRWL